MPVVALATGIVAASSWRVLDARVLHVARFMDSGPYRRAVEVGVALFVGLAVDRAVEGSVREGAFALICGVVLLGCFRLLRQTNNGPVDRDRRTPTSMEVSERPAWIPAWWSRSPSTEYLAASPWHALGFYGPLALVSLGLIGWRLGVAGSDGGFFGHGGNAAVTCAAIAGLAFNWTFGARAVAALIARWRDAD